MSAASVTTDINGLASIVYITGGTVGTNTVTAQGAGTAGAVTFTGITVLGSAREIVKITSDPVTGVTAGANQTLTVEVRDNQGNPLVSQAGLVTFAMVSGGGSIAEAQPMATDGSGRASATLTTGTSVGRNVVSVSVSGAVTLFYEVETIAGTAAITTAVTAPAATVFTGVTAGDQRTLTVKVTDANNNPVAGNIVTFANTAGSGSMSAASVTTDINGLASIVYITGGTAGTNTVTAQGAGTAGAVTFTGITVAGNYYSLIYRISPSLISGIIAGQNQTLSVEVRDLSGTPIANTAGLVTFAVVSGGGSITEVQPMATDGSGQASATLTTGTSVGRNVVSVSVSGAVPVIYEVETIAGAASQVSIISQDPGNIRAGEQFLVTAQVVDVNNTPVSNESVTWNIAQGNGTVMPVDLKTGLLGTARAEFTTSINSGLNSITASANSITSAAFNITTKKWDDFAVKISSLNSSDALLEEVTGAFEVEFSHLLDGSGGYSDITINSIKVTVSDENNKEIAPDSIIQKFIVKSDSGSQTYIETSSISSTNPQTLALVPAPVIQAGGSSVKLKVYYVVKANTTEDYVKVSIKRYDDIDAIVTGGMPARAIVDVDSLLLSSAAAVKAPYEIELYSDQQDNTKLWIRIYDKRSNTALPSVKIVQNGFSIPALANVILAEEDSSDTVAPKYYRGEYKVINGYSGSAAVYVNNILVDNVFIGRPVYTAPAIQVLTSSDKQDPASITIPVGSLAATPEFMAILPGFSASRSGELIAVGKMRHIGPLNFTLGSGCILKMTYSDDQVLGRDESKTGIYKFSVLTRKWEYLRDSKVNAGTNSVEAQITSGGTYSLFSDETAPEIVDIKEIIVSELSRDENMRIKDALMGIRAFASNDTVPVARALVNDFGSGINSEKIEVYVDSHLQNQSSWIYNPQEGRIYFLADASLGEGDHQISFSVSDYSGNISQAKSSVFTLSGAQNIVSLRPYPNPAQVISKIRYELAHPADEVILKIYNNADHHIISIEGTSFAGVNEIIWDLTDESGFEAANGIYPVLLRVKTGNEIMEKITTIAVLR
jgi:protocatechuate 3,4-dioxygenase beta subunit